MVIRPAKLPTVDCTEITKGRVVCKEVGGLTPLEPIGDLCACRKIALSPAIVPKPICALCNEGVSFYHNT